MPRGDHELAETVRWRPVTCLTSRSALNAPLLIAAAYVRLLSSAVSMEVPADSAVPKPLLVRLDVPSATHGATETWAEAAGPQ